MEMVRSLFGALSGSASPAPAALQRPSSPAPLVSAARVSMGRGPCFDPVLVPSLVSDHVALLALIRRLGFVQVDSVNTVERAHHMILWSRRQSYRPENLARLLERDRALFEHWTHDASVIPTEFFGHWKLRFARDAERIRESWTAWQGAAFHDRIEEVLAHGAVFGCCPGRRCQRRSDCRCRRGRRNGGPAHEATWARRAWRRR